MKDKSVSQHTSIFECTMLQPPNTCSIFYFRIFLYESEYSVFPPFSLIWGSVWHYTCLRLRIHYIILWLMSVQSNYLQKKLRKKITNIYNSLACQTVCRMKRDLGLVWLIPSRRGLGGIGSNPQPPPIPFNPQPRKWCHGIFKYLVFDLIIARPAHSHLLSSPSDQTWHCSKPFYIFPMMATTSSAELLASSGRALVIINITRY